MSASQLSSAASGQAGTFAPISADWKASTSYVLGSLVSYAGKVYRVSTAHISTSTFDATKFTEQGSSAPGPAGTVAIHISDTAPTSPSVNVVWIDTNGG